MEQQIVEKEPVVRRSGGEAFVIYDENDTPTKLPPRRLKVGCEVVRNILFSLK